MMERTISLIDHINEVIGRSVAWLVLALVLVTFTVAVLRYGFSVGWVWMQETYVWLHAVIFLTAAGYTAKVNEHVRIDVFYGRAGARTRAFIDLAGTLLLLLPMLAAIAIVVGPYVALSVSRLESSSEAGGMPGLFMLKAAILLFVATLALQGLATILRALIVLRGSPPQTGSGPA
ncbi:MAG: TRAP transporter small permease subunit [Hyphomicrobiaceae bacterium]|nr:TRAP transporter small permease subunit [Hyphomicrobiaceae bacterium]